MSVELYPVSDGGIDITDERVYSCRKESQKPNGKICAIEFENTGINCNVIIKYGNRTRTLLARGVWTAYAPTNGYLVTDFDIKFTTAGGAAAVIPGCGISTQKYIDA